MQPSRPKQPDTAHHVIRKNAAFGSRFSLLMLFFKIEQADQRHAAVMRVWLFQILRCQRTVDLAADQLADVAGDAFPQSPL